MTSNETCTMHNSAMKMLAGVTFDISFDGVRRVAKMLLEEESAPSDMEFPIISISFVNVQPLAIETRMIVITSSDKPWQIYVYMYIYIIYNIQCTEWKRFE